MADIRKHIDRVNRYVVDELVAETARNRYKQSDVATALGLAQSAVSDRYRRKVALSVGEFVAWCDLVNRDPARLLESALRRLAETPSNPDFVTSDGMAIEIKTYPAAADAVSGSRDDFDLVAGGPDREPDGDDEPHFN